MKSASDPRQVYTRNGIVHILFGGYQFAPKDGKTEIEVGKRVRCEIVEGTSGRKSACLVTTTGKNQVTETWYVKRVPVHHRVEEETASE